MSKTFGKIFGSGKSQPVLSGSAPTGYESLSPEAKKTYDLALKNAGSLTAQNFAPAPVTAEQQQAAQYFGTPISTITPQEFQSGLSTFTNPYEEQVLQNTIGDITQNAQGGWRDIASMASDAGGFGSNRRGILEAELQKNLMKTIADTSAASRASNFENAAGRAINDIGQVRSMNQQNMGSLFDIGSRYQDNATAAQNAPAQLQQYLASLASSLQGGGGKTYTQSAPEGGLLSRVNKAFGDVSTFGQNVGTAVGKVASFLPSDNRLKENIVFEGVENGHNIYSWNYLEQPTKWLGVIAQEVRELLPEAVLEEDGFLKVNYGRIGIEMRLA
jgi:hypothetical protein